MAQPIIFTYYPGGNSSMELPPVDHFLTDGRFTNVDLGNIDTALLRIIITDPQRRGRPKTSNDDEIYRGEMADAETQFWFDHEKLSICFRHKYITVEILNRALYNVYRFDKAGIDRFRGALTFVRGKGDEVKHDIKDWCRVEWEKSYEKFMDMDVWGNKYIHDPRQFTLYLKWTENGPVFAEIDIDRDARRRTDQISYPHVYPVKFKDRVVAGGYRRNEPGEQWVLNSMPMFFRKTRDNRLIRCAPVDFAHINFAMTTDTPESTKIDEDRQYSLM